MRDYSGRCNVFLESGHRIFCSDMNVCRSVGALVAGPVSGAHYAAFDIGSVTSKSPSAEP